MRVEVRVEGGFAWFPGLNAPRVVETAKLPLHEARRVRRLVRAVDFFSQPAQIGMESCQPDCQTVTITVCDGDREHTVQAAEPALDAGLYALVEAVLGLAGAD
jgi:hypothetical protein